MESDNESYFSNLEIRSNGYNSEASELEKNSTKSQRRRLMDSVKGFNEEHREKRLSNNIAYLLSENPKIPKETIPAQTLYLDLSHSNVFAQPLSFPTNLAVLRLSGNAFDLSKLPSLPKLRTLFLDNCRLTTLEGFPKMPQLKFLSLENNSISGYIGLPMLPVLSSLDLRGNIIEFSPVSALIATASIYLTSFNGAFITESVFRTAFSQSPLVGFALRNGMSPKLADQTGVFNPTDVIKFLSQDFNLKLSSTGLKKIPTSLHVTQDNENGWSIIFPLLVERSSSQSDKSPIAKNLKWMMSSNPFTSEFDEWEIINVPPGNTLFVTTLMHHRIIRCTFTLEDDDDCVYSMYTPDVIGYEQGSLNLPYPLIPKVSGDLREQSLVSMIPMPIPVNVTWYSGNDIVVSDSFSLIIDFGQVGKEIVCSLEPYCPFMSHIKFSKLITKTGTVQSLSPTVTSVTFPSILVEDQEIWFDRTLTPNREGESVIYIEKSKTASDNWERIGQLYPLRFKYTPQLGDVDHFLRIVYLPVLNDGTKATEPSYFYSSTKVLPAMPEFINARIIGKPCSYQPIIALAQYKGGHKGKCHYSWFASPSVINIDNINDHEVIKCNGSDAFFVPQKEHEGLYFGCEMTPIRDDDVIGESQIISIDHSVEKGERINVDIQIPKLIRAHNTIQFSHNSKWFITSSTEETGLIEVGNGFNFTPAESMIGQLLVLGLDGKFHAIGEVLPGIKKIDRFELANNDLCVGDTVSISPIDGIEDYEIVWVKFSGKTSYVVDIDAQEYTISPKDQGFKLKVILNPKNDDHSYFVESYPTQIIKQKSVSIPIIEGYLVEGSTLTALVNSNVFSISWLKSKDKKKWELTKKYEYHSCINSVIYYAPVYSEDPNLEGGIQSDLTYSLSSNDVGFYYQVEIIDGELNTTNDDTSLNSTGKKLVSYPTKVPISPGEFSFIMPSIPNGYISEGETINIRNKGKYEQNSSQAFWEICSLNEIEEEEWRQISQGFSYTFKPEDVGRIIRCRYQSKKPQSVHKEGILHMIEFDDIRPLSPSVSEVHINQNNEGMILVDGKYLGGRQKEPIIQIAYISNDSVTLIQKVVELNSFIQRNESFEALFYPNPEIFKKRIDVCYTPNRYDGEQGSSKWSSNSIIVASIPIIREAQFVFESENLHVGSSIFAQAVSSSSNSFLYKWTKEFDGKIIDLMHNQNKYVLTNEDDGIILKCEIIAISSRGRQSKPFIISNEINLLERLQSLELKVLIPKHQTKVQSLTKRKSLGSMPSFDVSNSAITGDVLTAVIVDKNQEDQDVNEDLDTVLWQRVVNQEKVTVSRGKNYRVSFSDIGFCIIASHERLGLHSAEISPITLNTAIESNANAVIRANSLKFIGKAVKGNGEWEISFNNLHILMKNKNGSQKKINWADAQLNQSNDNSIELIAGPGQRYLFFPILDETSRTTSLIPKGQGNDFIFFIFYQYKNK